MLAGGFAMLHPVEREWLPVCKMGWRTHRRVAFQMDGKHPMGGSHHQKRVVIDDKLAFIGGRDLTRSRWDTPEHAAANLLRICCESAAQRCERATVSTFSRRPHDVRRRRSARDRPACARALAARVRSIWRTLGIAISLTEPAFAGRPGLQQISR
jgi:phospholipase D1/2